MVTASPENLRALELVLTAGCNLRCQYCYQNEKKNRSIDWSVARAALDRILASQRSRVQVLFIGGEPLLEFPMIERAVSYLADHKRPDMRIRLAIITNGLLLGERELEFLIAHRFHVQLSFDGLEPAQQQRGHNTFSRLDALLDQLRREYPGFYENYLKVNITLLPSTIRWLADSVEYFVIRKRLGELLVTPQITETSEWRFERIDELDQAFKRIFRVCLQRYRETGDVPLQVFRKTAGGQRRRTHIDMCGVGRGDQLAVDVDGQAHGCLTFVGSYQTFPTTFLRSRVEAMQLGDVRDINFRSRLKAYPATVRSAEIFHDKELKYSSYGRCGDCRYLADCSICPMSIGRTDAEADPRKVPDFNCAYNLISLRYRDRFPVMRTLSERLLGPPIARKV